MARRPLARVLGPELAEKFTRAGMSCCKDVVFHDAYELVDGADICYDEASDAVTAVSLAVAPKPRKVSELECSFLPLGLPALDDALKGGLPFGCVAEVVGPPGVGKTQLCMSLGVAAAAKPATADQPACQKQRFGGLGQGVAYIDTEGSFSPERVLEIARERLPSTPVLLQLNHADEAPAVVGPATHDDSEMLARVFVFRPQTVPALVQCLDGIDTLLVDKCVRLLVVDSIAAVVRSEFGANSAPQRQDFLFHVAARLKSLAEAYGLVVLCTNQVTGCSYSSTSPEAGQVVAPERSSEARCQDASSTSVVAALGPSWAHCPTTRIVLEHASGAGPQGLCHRVARIAKSPAAPNAGVLYTIWAGGLRQEAAIDCPAGDVVHGPIQLVDTSGIGCLDVNGQFAAVPHDPRMPDMRCSEIGAFMSTDYPVPGLTDWNAAGDVPANAPDPTEWGHA